jgi:polyhydroxyalkanoate synthesis regulator phasin
MAWTDAEKQRVEAIELMLNNIQTIIAKLASQAQLRSLSVLKQKEINELTARVATLESQVATLQKNSI